MTLIEHRGNTPVVDPTAYVAPTAVLSGDVRVGPDARILPPGAHDEIWEVQQALDFPGTVYGVERESSARERMQRQADWFAAHRDDKTLDMK